MYVELFKLFHMATKSENRRSQRNVKSIRKLKREGKEAVDKKDEVSTKPPTSTILVPERIPIQDKVNAKKEIDMTQVDEDKKWEEWLAESENDDETQTSEAMIVQKVMESLKTDEHYYERAKVSV